VRDAAPIIAKARWFAFAVMLINDPAITATASVASPDDAKMLADDLSSALAEVKGMAANPDPNGPPLALFAPIINQIVDSLKPTPSGSQVTVGLKGPVLPAIANMAMSFGAFNGGFGRGPAPQ
jgi:hypothetical protein